MQYNKWGKLVKRSLAAGHGHKIMRPILFVIAPFYGTMPAVGRSNKWFGAMFFASEGMYVSAVLPRVESDYLFWGKCRKDRSHSFTLIADCEG